MVRCPMCFEYIGKGEFEVTSVSNKDEKYQICLKDHSCSCKCWRYHRKKVKRGKLKGKATCQHLENLKARLWENPASIINFKENHNFPECFKRVDWDNIQE